MNFVKNIAIVVCASSFMFAGIGFHMANNYGDMDTGTTTTTSWGVTYDLNDNTSVGWDENMGMLMMFDVPFGVSLRLGWSAGVDGNADADFEDDGDTPASTSVGLGYTWWSGGEGLKTSLSTNYDYVMAPGATVANGADENSTNLSVTVGFGF
jgi:hypothetical protein